MIARENIKAVQIMRNDEGVAENWADVNCLNFVFCFGGRLKLETFGFGWMLKC